MPNHIIDLYIYFLCDYYKSNRAFDRFYDSPEASKFKRYAILGSKFYSDYMIKYSGEIREIMRRQGRSINPGRMVFK